MCDIFNIIEDKDLYRLAMLNENYDFKNLKIPDNYNYIVGGEIYGQFNSACDKIVEKLEIIKFKNRNLIESILNHSNDLIKLVVTSNDILSKILSKNKIYFDDNDNKQIYCYIMSRCGDKKQINSFILKLITDINQGNNVINIKIFDNKLLVTINYTDIIIDTRICCFYKDIFDLIGVGSHEILIEYYNDSMRYFMSKRFWLFFQLGKVIVNPNYFNQDCMKRLNYIKNCRGIRCEIFLPGLKNVGEEIKLNGFSIKVLNKINNIIHCYIPIVDEQYLMETKLTNNDLLKSTNRIPIKKMKEDILNTLGSDNFKDISINNLRKIFNEEEIKELLIEFINIPNFNDKDTINKELNKLIDNKVNDIGYYDLNFKILNNIDKLKREDFF